VTLPALQIYDHSADPEPNNYSKKYDGIDVHDFSLLFSGIVILIDMLTPYGATSPC
jgi:hypothetical protein